MRVVPAATLILTVLNEQHSLPDFLLSLSAQEQLPEEIVVVDGGSTDATASLFMEWDAPVGCTLRVIVSPGANISEGRNQAVVAASHDRILVTDAGTSLDPQWASRMLAAFDGTDSPDVVSGFFTPTGETLVERAIAFAVTPRLTEVDPATFLPSSRSIGFTRDAWKAAGGYPEWLDYCEDLVFDLKLKELGHVFTFEGGAIVTWSARPTIRDFMKQYYRYARGDGKAGLWSKRHAARYGAYLVGAVLLALSFVWPWAALVLAFCAAVYLSKFWKRVWLARGAFGPGLVRGLLLVPVIVVAGDLAKMAGYPVGLRWARSRAAAGQG